MYSEENLVRIAKRENNKKRNYLVINRLQGKHIPANPQEIIGMFKALASIIKEQYLGERLLFIGFAETATAIGAAVALELKAAYIQTTRESIPNVDYLYFSEEHSHATEQKLVKNDIDAIIDKIDRIIFVEDEVTTGKTILNIVNILEKLYSDKIHFSVASILNGMDEEALKSYKDRKIALHWLVKTDHVPYAKKAELYKGDGNYIKCSTNNSLLDCNMQEYKFEKRLDYDENESNSLVNDCYIYGNKAIKLKMSPFMDTRRLVYAEEYAEFCERIYLNLLGKIDLSNIEKLLVLGTEEFMYLPLYIAEKIAKHNNINVKFHATTRSPIAVSTEETYPLHTRYELKSFYDAERITYIYDLDEYDCVLVITDANGKIEDGYNALMKALVISGNDNIFLVY